MAITVLWKVINNMKIHNSRKHIKQLVRWSVGIGISRFVKFLGPTDLNSEVGFT